MGTDNIDIHRANGPGKRCGYSYNVPPEREPWQASDKRPEEAEKRKFDGKDDSPHDRLISKKKSDAVHHLLYKIGRYRDRGRILNQRLFRIKGVDEAVEKPRAGTKAYTCKQQKAIAQKKPAPIFDLESYPEKGSNENETDQGPGRNL
ncbi:hypothetical protein MMC12_004888 [Toensbergia leucococca]|nr:hypothetical protein [Toensbergia leucococca]